MEPQGQETQSANRSGVHAPVLLGRVDAGGLARLVFTHPLLTMSPVTLAHTAPVSPGLALAAWEASEQAKAAPKPKRKGWVVSISTHGFKSFRISATRFL